MRHLRVIAALFQLLVSTKAAAGQTSPCLPNDSGATTLVQYVNRLITSTDSAVVALRGTLGLNNLNVSQVSVITSGTSCSQARQAVDNLANTPNSSRRMYVVKAGSKRFFVRDPNATAGEWTPALVFDNKWLFIKSLLGG
jgi:hypothetical protein